MKKISIKIIVLFLFVNLELSAKPAFAVINGVTPCSMAQFYEKEAMSDFMEIYDLKRGYAIVKSLDVGDSVYSNIRNKIKEKMNKVESGLAAYADIMKSIDAKTCPSAVM